MARSVVFDVETTGLEPERGHKIIEIAAIELINDLPTGDEFRTLINPHRDIPAEATRVHGIVLEQCIGAPSFSDVAEDIMAYFGDSLLIAHNAPFDIGFIDFELTACRYGALLPRLRSARVMDTLALARERLGVGGHTLDSLCRRFGIDTSVRKKHSALLDCRLLAAVYLQLLGGSQRGLEIPAAPPTAVTTAYGAQTPRQPRYMQVSEDEAKRHDSFAKMLVDAIWCKF